MELEFEIQRVDLNLRSKYPHFKTSIYKIHNHQYEIYVENAKTDFKIISNEFNRKIRFLTSPVKITQKIPSNYEKAIPSLPDTKIADSYAGMPFTAGEMKKLLNFKFPNYNILTVAGVDKDRKIKVYIESSSKKEINDVQLFCDSIKAPVPFKIINDINTINLIKENKRKRESEEKENPRLKEISNQFNNPVLNLIPTRNLSNVLDIEKHDEEFWFSKVSSIYNGEIKRNDLIKNCSNKLSCFIDYCSFSNINIRNGVLLYDKVYIDLPFEKNKKFFFESQKINENDFLSLIQSGKLSVVLTQPSTRYDYGFLKELNALNSNAILSRRKIAAIILADFIEILDSYFIKKMDLNYQIENISLLMAEMTNVNSKTFYSFLTWPYRAVRDSFHFFTFNSTKRIPSVGINSVIEELLPNKKYKDLELEFSVNSENVHISHALNAVFYPSFNNNDYSNRPFASLMGNILNLYSNSSIEKLKNYVDTREKIVNKAIKIDPINLIEINEFWSIDEIDEFAKSFYTPTKLNSILSYLSEFDDQERNYKINEYNKEIKKILNKSRKTRFALDCGVTIGSDIAGFWVPFLGSGIKALEIAGKKIGNTKEVHKIIDKIETLIYKSNEDKKNISFLSKINSVARLKNDYTN